MPVGTGVKRVKPTFQQVLLQLNPFFWQGDASWKWNTKVELWTGAASVRVGFSRERPCRPRASPRDRATVAFPNPRVTQDVAARDAIIDRTAHASPLAPLSASPGSGEVEAFCELFFDNLATLLTTTGAAIGDIGYGVIDASWRDWIPETYRGYIAVEWEKIFYQVRVEPCDESPAPPRRASSAHAFRASRRGSRKK